MKRVLMRALWSRLVAWFEWHVPTDETLAERIERQRKRDRAALRKEQMDARRDRIARMTRPEINAAWRRGESL